jgi:hypothetical protein
VTYTDPVTGGAFQWYSVISGNIGNAPTTADPTKWQVSTLSLCQVNDAALSADITAIGSSNSQTTVSGSTSGTAVFSQPVRSASYKKIVIYCSSLLGTASYTFPTPFVNTPVIVATNGPASSVVTSLSTTAITVTGVTTSGFVILEGY